MARKAHNNKFTGNPDKLRELKEIMRLAPTLKDVSAFFDVSEDTIERTIRQNYDLTFAEFKDQNMVHTRFSLIRKAIQEATKDRPNTAMLIFALKNLCGWKDRFDEVKLPEEGDDNTIYLAYEIKKKEQAIPVKAEDVNKQLDA